MKVLVACEYSGRVRDAFIALGHDAISCDLLSSDAPGPHYHGETKATCLWLKNLRNLEPTDIVEGREARVHKMPSSKDRWKIRSTTYYGIARAMADQWGRL